MSEMKKTIEKYKTEAGAARVAAGGEKVLFIQSFSYEVEVELPEGMDPRSDEFRDWAHKKSVELSRKRKDSDIEWESSMFTDLDGENEYWDLWS